MLFGTPSRGINRIELMDKLNLVIDGTQLQFTVMQSPLYDSRHKAQI